MALALIVSVRKLCPYFQAYDIIVPKDTHLKQVLFKPEVANQLKKWSIELSEFDIEYVPYTTIKGWVMADFLVEIPIMNHPVRKRVSGHYTSMNLIQSINQ